MSIPATKYLLRELSKDYVLKPVDFLNEKISLGSKGNKKYEILENGNLLFKNVLLQCADKENGNGRVYPYKILKRETDSYQSKIDMGNAVGSAGHPECQREGTKILTKDGWKDFRNISENEVILTYNTNNDKLEYQKINKKISQYVEIDLIHFKSKITIDTAVTPGHRFYLKDRHGKGNFYTAEELYQNRIKYNHFYIPKKGEYIAENNNDTFILSNIIPKKGSKELKEKYSQDLKIDMKLWSAFLGLYLAEGFCGKKDSNYSVHICQNEGEKAELIEELLNKLPFKWWKTNRMSKSKNKNIIWHTTDIRLCLYLRKLGCAWEKYIPIEMKNIKKEYLENIINWYHLGDGRTYISPTGQVKKDIFSTSLKMIEDFSEILIKIGQTGNIKTEIRNNKDCLIEGRVIKKENRRIMYFLNISEPHLDNGLYLTSNRMNISKKFYKGNVYCVNVPNQTFFCMDNDKIYISGNSSVIDPMNVSHHIDKIWWEGKEVRGNVRLLSTTTAGREMIGLAESDITLAISSRSAGSVTKKSNHVEVNDDLELICWDIVIEPSTEKAYINESKLIILDEQLNKSYMELYNKFDRLLSIRGK